MTVTCINHQTTVSVRVQCRKETVLSVSSRQGFNSGDHELTKPLGEALERKVRTGLGFQFLVFALALQ